MKISHELRDLRRLVFRELWMVASQAVPEMRDELMARTCWMVRVSAPDTDAVVAGPILIRHPTIPVVEGDAHVHQPRR